MISQIRLAVACAVMLPLAAQAQGDRPKSVSVDLAAGAVAQVRGQYFKMDYVGGAADADRLLKQFPRSRELAAWRAANLSRISRPLEAKAAADALLKADSSDAWGWFARAVVLEYASEGIPPGQQQLKASLEAYRRAPNNADVQWLRAVTLSGAGESAHALALIDSIASRGPLPRQLLGPQANAMHNTSQKAGKFDKAKADSAFALYAKARSLDTTDVTSRIFAASRLAGNGRPSDAYVLAKEGVRLSPLALGAHETYWQSIDGLRDRTQAARDSEVLGDVERLLAVRGNEPTVLSAAAYQYTAHRKPDRARELEVKLLAVAPASLPAEWVFVNRYRAAQTQLRDSASHDTASYVRALWAFIDRPTHISERLLGDAYRDLFFLSDSTTNADTLLRIVKGMVRYEGINPHIAYSAGAIRLAERGRDFKVAEEIARAGVKEAKARIDEQKDIYETVGDYAAAVDWMTAFMYDALGVVYTREGRFDDARKQLEHARELDPRSRNALLHLGQLSERQSQLDQAESYYMKGSLIALPGVNPNRAALQKLFNLRHGSLEGYDSYLAGIAEADRASRRAAIAKTQLPSPTPLQPFQLQTLDGKLVTVDSLRGRAAVINNWGMWCGPCVAELPEIQALSVKYAGDTTVRILTIDNDRNTDSLRLWMGKKNYTFTTLLDDGYLSRVNNHGFPTTWFLDQNGRVVFTKTGWSEKLVEEFGWRIEMLKQPRLSP
jgi:tetratricopeptide (TPR) repeat protein